VGETVPIRHLGLRGEKTLKNLNSNNLDPNASKALLTQKILVNHLVFKTYLTNSRLNVYHKKNKKKEKMGFELFLFYGRFLSNNTPTTAIAMIIAIAIAIMAV
jgi:hypothetical protein